MGKETPQAGGRWTEALRAWIGGCICEQTRELSSAQGSQAIQIGGLPAVFVVLRLGAHKTLNAQDAQAVFDCGNGVTELLSKLAFADRNAPIAV